MGNRIRKRLEIGYKKSLSSEWSRGKQRKYDKGGGAEQNSGNTIGSQRKGERFEISHQD